MRRLRDPFWLIFLLVWVEAGSGATVQPCAQIPPTRAPALYGYEVVAEYPHDPKAFTQGTATLDELRPNNNFGAARRRLRSALPGRGVRSGAASSCMWRTRDGQLEEPLQM